MSSGKVGVMVAVIAVIIMAIIMGLMAVSYSNREIDLRKQAEAQQKVNEVIYTKVWTVIKQKAQVTDKYASDFKEVYVGIMSGRYDADKGSNPAFKWISEQNPSFSVEMYKSLSDSIEGLRAEFARVQNRLVDIKREHDTLREKFPSNLVVGKRPSLEIQIVTSAQTKEVFATGEENKVDVF